MRKGILMAENDHLMEGAKMEFDKTNYIDVNLIPNCPNPTPDYYCTWQTQLYVTSDGKPAAQRAIIGEKALFDREKPYGWAYFYEKARRDLFLVMDDSWDVPVEGGADYYGCLCLNAEKFPEATGGAVSNAKALKRLTEKIRALGWKGLGGWVCAQESDRFIGEKSVEEYWTERMLDAKESGFAYWKVDWGKKGGDPDFRRMLTDMGRRLAPDLIIEHAITKSVIPYADTYRTYDVPAIMSIPMTMEKIRDYSDTEKPREGYLGLINCEDEAYIAAAGGFAMGIMRHPYVGELPDGRADMSFPEVHRNLKRKMTEVVRAARWHRMAPAFGVGGDEIVIDTNELVDSWRFMNASEEIENWWLKNMPPIRDHIKDHVLVKSGPARIGRRTELPEVKPDKLGRMPYVVAARNPNGAYSIVTAGRTIEREYDIPLCDVTAKIGDACVIGIFGRYKSLTLEGNQDVVFGTAPETVSDVVPEGVNRKLIKILAQDLADDKAYDITEFVVTAGGKITVPGTVIDEIGTLAQPREDTSEPGLVLKIQEFEKIDDKEGKTEGRSI